jgi:hypothetical protein
MDQDTAQISKKELLEFTGISYGQLYRWKRKGLIPEAWFIKKAAFTGQETFFPRTEILDRVQRIQGMKEDLNLDQLAGLLSPDPAPVRLAAAEWVARNIVSKAALDLLGTTLGATDPLDFHQVLHARTVDQLVTAGEINLEEAALLLRTLAREGTPPGTGLMVFLRKRGVGVALVLQAGATLDPEARVVARIDLAAQVTELKLLLNGGRS